MITFIVSPEGAGEILDVSPPYPGIAYYNYHAEPAEGYKFIAWDIVYKDQHITGRTDDILLLYAPDVEGPYMIYLTAIFETTNGGGDDGGGNGGGGGGGVVLATLSIFVGLGILGAAIARRIRKR